MLPVSHVGREAPVGRVRRLPGARGRVPARGRIVFRVHMTALR